MKELTDDIRADDMVAQRLRAALEPAADSARRVADEALSRRPHRGWRLETALLGVLGVVAILFGVGIAVSPATAPVGPLSGVAPSRISSVGRMVIAEDGEGEIWISGSSAQSEESQPGTRMTFVLKEVSP
jgi:hypothetical protein